MSQKPFNIAMVGSIGVGKSTLVNALAQTKLSCFSTHTFIPSASRLIAWEPALDDDESVAIHNWQRQFALEQAFLLKAPIVCDRFFIDRLTWELAWPSVDTHLGTHADLAARALLGTLQYADPKTLVVFVPIEFPWQGDSDPRRDPAKCQLFDSRIRAVLCTLHTRYTIVSGSVEQRVRQIVDQYMYMSEKSTNVSVS